MALSKKLLICFLAAMSWFFSPLSFADSTNNIPILCYHNLNPTKAGWMNMTPEKFESQIKWLKDNGFTIIPLKEAVDYLQGNRASIPDKAVVLTADDGWESDFSYMLPIIKKYNVPVTLFIYPQTISQGKNALTWEQLKQLQATGLFDIQGHTYSHPNFRQAKKSMSPAAYEKFVTNELVNSKKILEEKMGTKISFLAWPFGIYNTELENAAKNAGYVMAFTIDYRAANKNFRPMAQPRYMIIDKLSQPTFVGIANTAKGKTSIVASNK